MIDEHCVRVAHFMTELVDLGITMKDVQTVY